MRKLSEIIRSHRKKAGLTQKGLADLAGLGKTVIFDIEKGKDSVRFDSLSKVLNVLNLKLKINGPLLKEDEFIDEKN